MKLKDWLATRKIDGLTQEQFGRQIGLTQGRISQIANGGTRDLETALAIEKATSGDVKVCDLLPGEVAARLHCTPFKSVSRSWRYSS